MTGLVFLLLAQAAAAPVPVATVTVTEMTGRLVIPDEIASAVMPYMACRLRTAGVPVRKPGEPIPDQLKPSGEDCSKIREKASRDALSLLNRKHVGRSGDRKKLVTDTLDQIDQFTPVPASASAQ